ncbi:hypothetical protein CCACVL1_03266 [Corchorus capsularis]|uniref:Uncharacterized protein n=1 Tax=Corchorus capsularis TaxID=210143 RepID=A0A1R3K1D2_COCAP|nr:hypothetical protein CCACVL1_03266 [Corchorus capsularis]
MEMRGIDPEEELKDEKWMNRKQE